MADPYRGYRYKQNLGRTGEAFRNLGTSFGDLFEGLSYGRRMQEAKDKEKRTYGLQRRQLGDVPITQAELYQMLEDPNTNKMIPGIGIISTNRTQTQTLPTGVEQDPYGQYWKRKPAKPAAKKFVSVPVWVNGKKIPMRLPDDGNFNARVEQLQSTGKVSFEAPKEIITMRDTKDGTITHYDKSNAEALKMSDPKRYQTYGEMEAKLKPNEELRDYYNESTGEHVATKFVDKKQIKEVDSMMAKKRLTPKKPKMSKIRWTDPEDNYKEEMVPELQYNTKVDIIKIGGGRLKDEAKTSFELGYATWKEVNPEGTREEYRREWLIEPGKLSEDQVTKHLLDFVQYDTEAFNAIYSLYLEQRESESREKSLNWVTSGKNVKINRDEDSNFIGVEVVGGKKQAGPASQDDYIWE